MPSQEHSMCLALQGCIPVGCVPTALYRKEGRVSVWGCLCQGETPGQRPPAGQRTPWTEIPPLVDRQMAVKILPCSKLRLRAVIMILYAYFPNVCEFLNPLAIGERQCVSNDVTDQGALQSLGDNTVVYYCHSILQGLVQPSPTEKLIDIRATRQTRRPNL